MADIESNIDININANNALAALKELQAQISAFHQAQSRMGLDAQANSSKLASAMMQNINSTGKFVASMQQVQTTTETFTTALEKNKLSMGEYFRFAGSQVSGFRKIFSSEFDTIDKVARERVKTLQTQYIKMGRDASGAMQAIAVRPVALDMENLGTQTAIAAQKHQIFNQLIKQGSTDLLNFGKNTQWAGRQLMVGFTVPLSIFGAAAAKEFMKIEEQMIRFKRVYGDTFTPSGETDAMLGQIRSLADEYTKYGVSIDKTLGLAADAAAMGKKGADLMAQVADTSKLAVLGGVDQQQALETTTSLTNTFGIAAQDLSKKIDFLNAVENQTVTSIQDLTTAIPIAAPVIQELGGNVEDLTFFLTAMKEGGINASEGANALKSGLASLINPSTEATTMLSEFGVNLEAIVQKDSGNVKQLIVDFASALDQLQPLQRAQAIEQLFGKFQFSRMSTLFQNVIAEGSQASRVLEVTKTSAAALAVLSEREMSKVEESPMYKFQAAMEKMQASLAPIGEAFLTAVTPIVEFVSKILEGFNSLSDGAKQFWVVLVAVVAAIGPAFLMAFGLIANGAANIIKLFSGLGNIFNLLSGRSTTVGQSLNYMSEEQLQAAAVAASLNQVHQNLHQTFTSEATAVMELAAAYRAAGVAAQGMTMPMTARTATRKMATGGMVYGPGNGTSDSVPTMLSNGEAVIPAASVARYPGLVQGLIAGNVQFMAEGGIAGWFRKQRGAPSAIAAQTRSMNWNTREAELAAVEQFVRELGLSKAQSGYVGGVSASHIEKDSEDVTVGGVTRGVKRWKAKNLIADNNAVNQYMERLSSQFGKAAMEAFSTPENINAVANKLGVKPQQVTAELKKLSGGKHPATLIAGKVTRELANFDYAGNFGGAEYVAGSASTALNARNMDDFYGNVKKRAYDPAKDAAEEARRAKAIATAQEKYAAEELKTIKVKEVATKNERSQVESISKQKSDSAKRGWETRRANQRKAAEVEAAQAIVVDQQAQKDVAIDKRRARARMVGGIGAIATTAVGVATMLPGPVGEVAQQAMPLVSTLSMLAPVLAALPAPAAIAVAAVAGVGFALFKMHEELVKSRDAATKFAETMGSGRKAMESMAEFTGTVNPSAEMAKVRQTARAPYEIVAGKETWGGQYIQSDAGKQMLAQAEEGIAKIGTSDVAAKLGNQFASQVAAGILSKEQAVSLAMNLGTELKNIDLTMDINAKLVELLGPEGQDLLKDPIAVQVKLVEDAAKQSAAPGGSEQRIIDQLNTFMRDYGKLAAAEADYSVAIKNTAESAQLALDTAEKAHLARLEEAKASGDINKVNEEQNRWLTEKNRLVTANTKAFDKQLETLRKLEKGGYDARRSGDQIVENMQQNIIKGTKEGSAQRTRATEVTNQLADNVVLGRTFGNESNTVKAKLLATVSVDNLELFQNLLTTFPIDKSPRQWKMIAEIGTTMGAGDMENLMATINQLTDKGMKEQVIEKIVSIQQNDPAAASKAISDLQSLTQISKSLPEGDVMQWDVYINPKTGEFTQAYNDVMAQIDQVRAIAAAGPIDVTMMSTIITDPDAFNNLLSEQAYIQGLPPEQRTLFMESYIKVTGQIDAKEVDAYKAKLGAAGAGLSDSTVKSMMGVEAAKSITQQAIAKPKLPAAAPPQPKPTGGGSGVQSSPLDDLLKKLKQIQDNTLKVTEGWGASRKALDSLFPGGGSFSPFNGIEQSMRRLGANEDLITMIAGMDPKEFEKRKNELFTFDGAGNIAGFRGSLLSIGAALRSITFGQFQNKQQELITTTRDQNTAVRKLVASGISLADAYEIAKDATMAQAIAQEGNNDIIRQATEQYHAAAKAAKDYAAASALVASNQQVADKTEVVRWLAANKDRFTNAQREAILGNNDLARIAMSPSIAPDALQTALDNAAKGVQFKIDEQMLTISGLETIFNDGFNKAMEAFSAQEKQIELNFAIKKEPLEKVVQAAEQLISDIQNRPGGIDDLQAELDRIGLKEQAINKAYDVRIKALDAIQSANETIARQKRSELSIAEALTQGDIAAAARAAQEMQAQQAADALSQQRKLLDDSRQLEIARVTGEMGLTREQIDARIRDLNAEILNIQETQVEPAKYQLELIDRQKQSQMESLRVLGLSRQQWESIKNRIDVAKTSSKEYEDAMKLARNVVADILAYWKEIEKPKTTVHTTIEYVERVYVKPNENTSVTDYGTPGGGTGSGDAAQEAAQEASNGGLTSAELSRQQSSVAERVKQYRASISGGGSYSIQYGQMISNLQNSYNSTSGSAKQDAYGKLNSYLVSKGFNTGGLVSGIGDTDKIRAMLTPGEFVVTKPAVEAFGASNLKSINDGTYNSGSVYNNSYSVNVSVNGSNNSAKDIANTVISEIKNIDAQRVRGNRLAHNV